MSDNAEGIAMIFMASVLPLLVIAVIVYIVMAGRCAV